MAAGPFLSDLERGSDGAHDPDCCSGGGKAILSRLQRKAPGPQMAVEKFFKHDYEPSPAITNAGS